MQRQRAHYLGTEIDERWWRRFRGEGFFARGLGELWLDDSALSFLRYLTDEPLRIPFAGIRAVRTGAWHSGRWNLGRPIVKVVWENEGLPLSSGFVVSRNMHGTRAFVDELVSRIPPGRRLRGEAP